MKKRLLLSLMALLTASGMWAADGDTFTAIIEHKGGDDPYLQLQMQYKVISEEQKTCETSKLLPWNVITIAGNLKIEIPGIVNGYTVVRIGDNSLLNANILGSVTIPATVEAIGTNAFESCHCLSEISIPHDLKIIGDYAFASCKALTTVYATSVDSLGKSAFKDCEKLSEIYMPNLVKISEEAHYYNPFYGTAWWKNGSGPVYIGDKYLGYRGQLPENVTLDIPQAVKIIPDYIFCDSTNLKSITINMPYGVTKLGDFAFEGCTNLKSVTLNGSFGLGKYGRPFGYFGGAYSKNPPIETLVINSENVPDMLKGWTMLQGVTFGNDVKTIEEEAFSGCTGLISVSIPEGVESVGSYAFYDCTSLETVSIKGLNTVFGKAPFGYFYSGYATPCPIKTLSTDCKNMSDMFEGCNTMTTVSFNCDTIKSCILGENVTTVHLGDNVKYVEEGGLMMEHLTTMTGGKNVSFVGMQTIIMSPWFEQQSDGMVYIGKCAFHYKGELPENTNYVFDDKTEGISDEVFEDAFNLNGITIPQNVAKIGRHPFGFAPNLSTLVVKEENNVYDSRNNCNAIIETATNKLVAVCNKTIIPNSVTAIEDYVFDGVETITSLIENPFEIGEQFPFDATLYVLAGTKEAYLNTTGWNQFSTILEMSGANITLHKSIETYASSVKLDFSTPIDGLKAYVVSDVTDGKATLTEVTGAVPAGTGLILKGTAGETYEIPYCIGDVSAITNKLIGVTVDTAIGGNDLDYILSNGKFVKASAGTLAAGKAYLKLDAALARGTIDIVGDVTGIDALLNNKEESIKNDEVYNLNGQRVSKPAKGLYIVNGKKVVRD